MQYFRCDCNNTLFFENSQCLSCNREVGWCPVCNGIHTIVPSNNNSTYTCLNKVCGAQLIKCHNYLVHNVCNRMVEAEKAAPVPPGCNPLCDYCTYTKVIPDLSVEGNIQKWYRLEVAKRRLLYLLDFLRLPYGSKANGFELPLSFDFKADEPASNFVWRIMGQEEKVYTGHADGKITINILEADPVEREKLRVTMGEAHRTLIGHFRHEIGHYYWQLLVQNKDEDKVKAVFGDFENPTYSEALNSYYQNGPKANWQNSYISAYATMHPWEDFAETWGAYFDMISVLDTSENTNLLQSTGEDLEDAHLDEMINAYLQLGMKVNEINRALGLLDVLPEIFSIPVRQKMQYIHFLIKRNQLPE